MHAEVIAHSKQKNAPQIGNIRMILYAVSRSFISGGGIYYSSLLYSVGIRACEYWILLCLILGESNVCIESEYCH